MSEIDLTETVIAPPAPLQRSDLELTARNFPQARTLPADAYLSEEVLRWEREHFFRASWVCLGRTDRVNRPGSQMATEAGGPGILIARGDDGELRAFHNTCRHRGHELLVEGASTEKQTIQCPYHRWTYDLDGTFRGGPGMALQQHFDRDDPENSLRRVRLHEWNGWIFANISGDAVSFDEHVGNLAEILEPYRPGSMFVATAHDYEISANWKIVVENFQECYHCWEIHPELCAVSSPTSGSGMQPTGLWIGGTMTLRDGVETMSLDGRSSGVLIPGLDSAAGGIVGYFMLFPNLLVSPHPDYLMTHRIEPLAPDRTRIECHWLFPPEARERSEFDPAYAADFWDLTNRQDWKACESVQRGCAGPGYRQAPYSTQEVQVYEFDLMIARGYLEGSVRAPVPHFSAIRGSS